MDSTLLDKIRHLCRDRAAYEHLKAILVQQERVHQLRWEEHYTKLLATSETQETDTFLGIIAREKALAQLAEAMQRSPSLDLVLQVAVQAAQKLLQVDRVAIFRHHPDGQGEFITDAIATGLLSLAEMPSRHSLTRHIIESTQIEDYAQTFNSISNSSLSTHSINLLEQIGIVSYAANKIYAGQELWGTIVAFHGSNYHSWSEGDRTSLSLISAQIGIAIALSNLRQQSQSLAHDLQVLQLEVNNLQQTVNEMAKAEIAKAEINETAISETQEQIKSPIPVSTSPIIEVETELIPEPTSESIIDAVVQYLVDNEHQNDFVNSDRELSNLELDGDDLHLDQDDQNVEEESSQVEEKSEIIEQSPNQDLFDTPEQPYEYLSIHQNGLPPTFLVPDCHVVLSDIESEDIKSEDIKSEDILDEIDSKDDVAIETLPLFVDEMNIPNLQIAAPILSKSELVDLRLVEKQVVIPEQVETPKLAEQPIEEWEVDEESKDSGEDAIAPESTKSVVEALTPASNDLDPVIEPQFIETILMLAGHGEKATEFLINVIDAYLQDAPNLLWEINRAIALKEQRQTLQFLNTLRSSSDYVGALILSQECRRLEAAVKTDNMTLTRTCLSLLEIEVERATEALRIERSRYT